MQSPLKWIIFKTKSYGRLFFKRTPTLRNATGIVLFIALGFYFIRFDQPLDFNFHQPTSKIEFIRADQLDQFGLGSASLELFDTAPLYIPTKWNYSSTVRPINTGLNQSDFIAFEPKIDLKNAMQIKAGFLSDGNSDFGTIAPEGGFDPRLITLFVVSDNVTKQTKVSSPIKNTSVIRANLSVDVLREDSSQSHKINSPELLTYKLDEEVSFLNLNPVIVFFRNDQSFVSEPKIYQSSSSGDFDRAILDWLNDPKHSQSLPNGYLKLTFFPFKL